MRILMENQSCYGIYSARGVVYAAVSHHFNGNGFKSILKISVKPLPVFLHEQDGGRMSFSDFLIQTNL